MNDPRGSIWRKWDLHIHSNASDGKMSCQQIIEKAKEKGISVIALTDHHTAKNIDEIKRLGSANGISVISGVEFKTEYGKKSVHLIGLLPDRHNGIVLNSKNIESELLNPLGLSEATIIAKGMQQQECGSDEEAFKIGMFHVHTHFKEIAEKIHELGGLVIPHATKENGIESEMGHEGKPGVTLHNSLGPVKEELFNDGYIDICEIRKENDNEDFYFENFKRASIIASDAHSLGEVGSKFTWIKADPTFEGLKQILNEPEPKGRVLIGDEPEVFNRVRRNKTRNISTISFEKIPGSPPDEKWFEGCTDIPFNSELVAIIGNKGSGKSALADTIGLLGNSKQQEHFSFLRKEKFCDLGNNKAQYFSASLKWEDGHPVKHGLGDIIDHTEEEMVSYIPQNYLETICSDRVEDDEFKKELKAVIFSHVDDTERLGCSSLDDLITTITTEKREAIEIIKKSINKLNLGIIKFERMMHPDYKKGLQNKLVLKEAERKAIEEPSVVKKPDDKDPIRQAKIEEITKHLAKKQLEIDGYTASIGKLQTDKANLSKRINDANVLLQKLKNFQLQFVTFQSECELLCSNLGISFENIAKLKVDTKDIETIKAAASTRLEAINKELLEDNKDGPIYKLSQAKGELEKLKAELDADNKKYQKYLRDMQEWKKECEAITGTEQNPEKDTILFYENILKRIDKEIPGKLQQLKGQRSGHTKDIYEKLDELRNDYETCYASVKDFMKSAPFSGPDELLLDFNVSIECKGFMEKFFYFVNRNKKGTFYGGDDAKAKLQAMLDIADFNKYDNLETFLKSIETNLEYDKRDEEKNEGNYVIEQLKNENEIIDFYDYLYDLDYLLPEFNLQWSGKKLYQLSPGERGLVLLIFYLFIDKEDTPLVIDQPEENLDNESVYTVLVKCIKEAKKRRQIIIVTHNPNLAVVCDAEQVIYAEIDKQNGNQIIYTCGAIENPIINKKLIDVLEGTRPAFNNRDHKYYV